MSVQISSILAVFIMMYSCSSKQQIHTISKNNNTATLIEVKDSSVIIEESDTFTVTKNEIKKDLYTSLKSDTEHFLSVDIDYDLDGHKDKIFYNSFLNGDSLFIFKNKNMNYTLSLKTINFSEDGLFVIDTVKGVIIDSINYIVVFTHFNGSGGLKKNEYLYYDTKKKQWFLSHTIFSSVECSDEVHCIKTTCKIEQNILLNTQSNWTKYRHFTEANKNECVSEILKN